MAGRERNTKKLAKRIERDYFKEVYPFERARRVGWIAAAIVSAGCLAWFGFARNSAPYNAGPIRSAHAVIAKNCNACHNTQTGSLTRAASDKQCKSCHDGPIHQEKQTFTPSCASCHVEHRGELRLIRTSTQSCARCHSDLKVATGEPRYATKIDTFETGHPEFAVLRNSTADPDTLLFNHSVHLKSGLRGPRGTVGLECGDCHHPNSAMPAMRYGVAGPAAEAIAPLKPVRYVSAAAYMAPVNFYEHCSGCHTLAFDARFTEPVPHEKPEAVHEFLVSRYNTFIAANPNGWRQNGLIAQIAERPPMVPPRNAQEWMRWRISETEALLWGKTCKECHALSFANGGSLPAVAPVTLRTRWFQNARFDHRAHEDVKCESCHDKSRRSKVTSDVLLPGIASCQECHRAGAQNAAEARCFECHDYHDWTKEKPVKGRYDIHQLVSEGLRVAPSS